MRRLPLLLLPLLLLACGGGSDGGAGSGDGDDALVGSDRPVNDLTVEQDLGDGTPPQRWSLVCAGSPTGDHPALEQACAHLAAVEDPFAPLPDDRVCTEQYGGPQTARITGVWGGEPVDLQVSRTDGCRIAQWDSLGPLLPGPVGVDAVEDAPQ
jgi:hypothetical protein